MSRERIQFGGIAGGVAADSLTPASLLSGAALGVALVLIHRFSLRHHAPAAGIAFAHALLALAYARFAINGRNGDGRGTFFSSSAESWAEAITVAGRYMLLSVIWILPLLYLGLDAAKVGGSLRALLAGGAPTRESLLAVLYVAGSILAPPVCLVASLWARGIFEVFSPASLREVCGGRLAELGLIYVVSLGAVTALCVCCLPLGLLAVLKNPQLGREGGVFLAACLAGWSVTLMGRLCGFYVWEEEIESSIEAEAVLQRADETTASTPELVGAQDRVAAAWSAYEADPRAAIATLEKLREGHAPHPLLAHALCIMLNRAGREAEALVRGREAVEVCFERDEVLLAAEVFRELYEKRNELELDRDRLLAIGGTFFKLGALRDAANAFVGVLRQDGSDVRATKGLLQVAEQNLRPGGFVEDAQLIYQFLLERCPPGPLTETMHHGLAESERRIGVRS